MTFPPLKRLNLRYDPFKEYGREDEDFEKIFYNREKEMGELSGAIEFFKLGSRMNIAVIGEPGSGKTTLLNYFLIKYRENKDILFFEHPNAKKFHEVLENVLEELGTVRKVLEGIQIEESSKDIVKDYLYEAGIYSRDIKVIHVVDDVNSMFIEDLDMILEVVSKSPDMFLITIDTDVWKKVVRKETKISKLFYPIYIHPLPNNELKMLVKSRIEIALLDRSAPPPFTDEAIDVLASHSFRNPGILINLCRKTLLNALSEGVEVVDEKFAKQTIYEKTGFRMILNSISKREMEILEAIISEGGEADFLTLEKKIGISRVAINDHVKDLIELEILEEADSPTKKKIFRITRRFRNMVS